MDSYTNTSLYEAIFKRKSFHLFRGVGEDRLVQSELEAIIAAWQRFKRTSRGVLTGQEVLERRFCTSRGAPTGLEVQERLFCTSGHLRDASEV